MLAEVISDLEHIIDLMKDMKGKLETVESVYDETNCSLEDARDEILRLETSLEEYEIEASKTND